MRMSIQEDAGGLEITNSVLIIASTVIESVKTMAKTIQMWNSRISKLFKFFFKTAFILA